MHDPATELRRIPLPRTRVNKPPADVPDPSGWHHTHGVDPLEKRDISQQQRGGSSVSSEDNNKALARRFLEAFANGDLHTLEELLAPDFINHSLLPGQAPGREGYIQTAAEKHAAFSDIRHIV